MCTAISFKTKDHYFGRTLDLEYHYNESVVVTPRNFPFCFRNGIEIKSHPAIIGIATIVEDYPLYYEATNEKGLSIAGLNFPDNTYFPPKSDALQNVAPFEFIPWILTQCENISDVKKLFKETNLANIDFSPEMKAATLHWLISDRENSITVEAVKEGLKVYDNPVGVLTNNPPFDYQITNLSNYLNLTAEIPQNRFSSLLDLKPYSKGMGAVGLPGDLSSVSRFVKAAFTKMNSVCGESEEESVSQFFHILGSVDQQKGCVHLGNGKYEITVYTSCCNTDKGIFYYTTYENSQISAVDMHREDLDSTELVSYTLVTEQQINRIN
ncbi:MAG: choloylglycine hydrolase [Clostridia bacterium]|nr:choloylglycine hydrolase [Clostridia bacterium]